MQRGLGAEEQAGEDVPAQPVGAEQVLGARRPWPGCRSPAGRAGRCSGAKMAASDDDHQEDEGELGAQGSALKRGFPGRSGRSASLLRMGQTVLIRGLMSR